MLQIADETVVILHGRSTFDRRQNVKTIADRLAKRLPRVRFMSAFEDLSGPALTDVLSTVADQEPPLVLVIPCAFPVDPTMSTWLAGALAAWREANGKDLDVRIGPAIEAFVDVDIAVLESCAATDRHMPVAAATPSMGKAGWSNVPEHGRQVFFCLGSRCAHRGARALYLHLRKEMKPHRPLTAGAGRVMCARSSCLFPCNLGPLLIVQPDGIWYGGLDAALVTRIVENHFLNGKAVEEAIIHRQSAPWPNIADNANG